MVSTDVLDIAPIGPDQSEAVWPLSIEAGWNQNAADWRFMLGREGRRASSIGPVVADSEVIALALIAHAARITSGPFILDVPVAHSRIGAWLERQGAVSPRAYMRMTLGKAEGLDDPSRL